MQHNFGYSEEVEQPISMHPKKFAMWLFIVSVVMIFAGLTSAFIVRQSEGNWLQYDLPNIFWFTSGIIILSSAFMYWSVRSAKKDQLDQLKMALGVTTVLGVLFLIGQWYSWVALVDMDVYFVGNPAGSFLYVLTGLHAIHLISGVIFLIIVLISSFKYRIHSKSLTQLEICATYWHFLGGLWLYLFMFLLINH